MKHTPKFITYIGPMFGAKTSALLLRLERFQLQGLKIVLFKPNVDKRYSTTQVVTHSGWNRDAVSITSGFDLLSHLENEPPDVVALDEAFMVKDSSKVLPWLFKNGMTVVVSSLDLSYKCEPFKEVRNILPYATEVHKCPAICPICGADAFYTYRKPGFVDDEIIVGGAELYEPRCYRHHPIINERMNEVEFNDDE